MEKHLGFVGVQPRNGTVTIPAEARRAFGLDKAGAQVEVIIRDGEIVLVPHVAVPASEAWFWSRGHQAAEREADADLAAGRYTDSDSAAEFLADLERLTGKGDSEAVA
ncbi:AbrB/MazE/SpoVT family DNA-binding domain-containing protein [Sphaerimonospora cavernae]|uniref:AbrB/MazE/SpoVT family DNA-binding domain-containing protein n=1 Tax=Sphaerimonospora cavernae TaxID=1740611 RepID=A0ABV6U1F1_9ACTN